MATGRMHRAARPLEARALWALTRVLGARTTVRLMQKEAVLFGTWSHKQVKLNSLKSLAASSRPSTSQSSEAFQWPGSHDTHAASRGLGLESCHEMTTIFVFLKRQLLRTYVSSVWHNFALGTLSIRSLRSSTTEISALLGHQQAQSHRPHPIKSSFRACLSNTGETSSGAIESVFGQSSYVKQLLAFASDHLSL